MGCRPYPLGVSDPKPLPQPCGKPQGCMGKVKGTQFPSGAWGSAPNAPLLLLRDEIRVERGHAPQTRNNFLELIDDKVCILHRRLFAEGQAQ